MVRALNQGEVDFSSVGIMMRISLWMLVGNKVGECNDEGSYIRVVWTKAHTTLEEKAKTTLEKRQAAWSNEKTDELAKPGATQDGAEVAKRVGEEARDNGRMCMLRGQPFMMRRKTWWIWKK